VNQSGCEAAANAAAFAIAVMMPPDADLTVRSEELDLTVVRARA
jgi:hypothetical protein